jgi:O-antigen/teichoic acid export membrane protein
VLASEFANSGLGFVFWVLAARLFSEHDFGTAAALVSLSSLATSIAILGLDNGLVRFATKVRNPRGLIRQLMWITGSLGAIVGFVLALVVLLLEGTDRDHLALLVGISVVLTVSQIWLQVTDSAILAAGRGRFLAARALSYGTIKVAVILVVVGMGVAGLFAAYTFPLLAVVMTTFLLLPRFWPRENEAGTPHRLRELATLSAGNWVSGFAFSLPSRVAPSLIFLFINAETVAYFFIALQLAEILNYVSEAIAKSLFAHGSREDRVERSLATNLRGLLLLILLPLIAVGVVAAPVAMSLVGGVKYTAHALSLQLFLLAVLPKSFYQILKAQFNVERRPRALILSGGSFGAFTVAFLVIGLVIHANPDLLPLAWVLGGASGLAVAQYLAGWRPRQRVAGLVAK